MADDIRSVSVTDLPDWMREPVQDIIYTGGELIGQPYQTYEGPRIADFSPLQQQAFDYAGGIMDLGGGYIEAAADYGYSGGLPWTAADMNAYINPYMQAAIDPAAQDMEREYFKYRNELGSQAGMNDAFGGSRHALLESEATRNYEEARGDLYAQGLANAYIAAVEAFNEDQTRKIQDAEMFADLGSRQQAMGVIGLDQMLNAGNMQQALEQSRYNLAYQDFLTQRDWPYSQLSWYRDLISGVPGSSSSISTTRSEQPDPNWLAQIAGLGIAGVSLLDMF